MVVLPPLDPPPLHETRPQNSVVQATTTLNDWFHLLIDHTFLVELTPKACFPIGWEGGIVARAYPAKQSPERGIRVGIYDEQLTAKCLPQLGGGAA